jgi:iron complex transport system substrate-binding protein
MFVIIAMLGILFFSSFISTSYATSYVSSHDNSNSNGADAADNLYAACKVVDDEGVVISLQKPAQRIISLVPDVTEILFAIGAGSQIVGAMQGSDYPLAAKQIPVVGSYMGIDLEKIISLHPDLIIRWGSSFSQPLSILKKMGIAVYTNEPRKLLDISHAMQNLGCLTGKTAEAGKQADFFVQRLRALSKQYQNKKKLSVFYQIGAYSLITINRESWINQVIAMCGGQNIFAQAKFTAPQVTWEAVLAANPQVVMSDALSPAWKSSWLKWSKIAAVKNNDLFTIHPDLIERAGPRLLQGAERVCESLQSVRDDSANL